MIPGRAWQHHDRCGWQRVSRRGGCLKAGDTVSDGLGKDSVGRKIPDLKILSPVPFLASILCVAL